MKPSKKQGLHFEELPENQKNSRDLKNLKATVVESNFSSYICSPLNGKKSFINQDKN